MLRVCMGAMRRVNHVKLVKFSIRQYQRSPQGHGSHHLCTLRAASNMVVDREKQKSGVREQNQDGQT